MKKKIQLFVVFVLVFTRIQFAQKPVEPDQIKTFNIIVNYNTYTVKTQMLKDAKKVKIVDDRTYMWCSANKIIETKAGYDGKLLHGYYKTFYSENNQLRESGTVKYGLKNKEWRSWYADGKPKELVTYKNGRKNGEYKLYNDYGYLMAKGCFKNDLLHGKFFTYDVQGNVKDKKKYRHGIEMIKKPKKEKKERRVKQNEKQSRHTSGENERTNESEKVKKNKKEKQSRSQAGENENGGKKQKPLKKEKSSKHKSVDPTGKKPLLHKLRDLFRKKETLGDSTEKKPAKDQYHVFKTKT